MQHVSFGCSAHATGIKRVMLATFWFSILCDKVYSGGEKNIVSVTALVYMFKWESQVTSTNTANSIDLYLSQLLQSGLQA